MKITLKNPHKCSECHQDVPAGSEAYYEHNYNSEIYHLFCSDLCHESWKLDRPRKKRVPLRAIYRETYGDGNDKYNPNL